jgi:hypothetical protein
MGKVRRIDPGFAIFVLACLYLWWLAGDVFSLGVDEGIYLEGGRRVAGGEAPYRDFAVLTGPLTFWIEGGLAWLSGGNIRAMRLPMVLDVAAVTWVVYWLSSRFAGTLFSGGVALTFLAFVCRVNRQVVNHRWDSAALAALAVAAAVRAHQTDDRRWWATAGALSAAAAWATPPVGLVGLVLAGWALWRRQARGFVAGGVAVSALAAGALAATDALGPMVEAMQWTRGHYTAANRLPYGSLTFASGSPFGDLEGLMLVASAAQIVHLSASGWILPLAVGVWGWLLWRRRAGSDAELAVPLLAIACASAAAARPRWSAAQLVYAMAPAFVLAAAGLRRLLPERVASTPPLHGALTPLQYQFFGTPAGTMRGTVEDEAFQRGLEAAVPRGSSLFVFCYAHNPTRYLFLPPGMMDSADQGRVIADLVERPPDRVRWSDLPPQWTRCGRSCVSTTGPPAKSKANGGRWKC